MRKMKRIIKKGISHSTSSQPIASRAASVSILSFSGEIFASVSTERASLSRYSNREFGCFQE